MNGVVLDLPVPPSVNARARRKRAWRAEAFAAIREQAGAAVLKGKVAVAVRLPLLVEGMDVDNRIKPLVDVLWRSRLMADDSQIDWLLIQWRDVTRARVVVTGISGGSIAEVDEVFEG